MTIRSGWLAYAVCALALVTPMQVSAEPGDVTLGIGAGLLVDLPDPAPGDHTRFAPGPGLMIPVRVELTPYANLRFTGRADVAVGNDRITWGHLINGEEVRFYDDDHFSVMILGGLTAGVEVFLPVEGAVRPYLGVGLGGGWVGTYHSLSGPTRPLLDPAQNDLTNPNNIDPYTSQIVLITDAAVGAMTRGNTSFWGEVGYSSAWVGARTLQKSLASYSARREAFGWNPVRITVGVQFAL